MYGLVKLEMNYYQKELKRIKSTLYANQAQIEAVIKIRHYIEQNFQAQLNLDALSETHHISKYHLIRVFSKYYGLTPRQYLINQRIKQAKQFLSNGMSVTETCFAIGLESLGSFSSLFKRKTGKSPTQFQKEQLSRSNLSSESRS